MVRVLTDLRDMGYKPRRQLVVLSISRSACRLLISAFGLVAYIPCEK